MEVNFKFTGRETKKIAAVMAALGMMEGAIVTAEVEQPKTRKPRVNKEPVADGKVAETEPDDTRLEGKEDKPSKPKRTYRRKSKKETFKIVDCLFLGMHVASTGRNCAIAAVSKGEDPLNETFGKYRLAFIDDDFQTATTNIQWFVDPEAILDQRSPTIDNAQDLIIIYN